MAPRQEQEDSPLLKRFDGNHRDAEPTGGPSSSSHVGDVDALPSSPSRTKSTLWKLLAPPAALAALFLGQSALRAWTTGGMAAGGVPTGPYRLMEAHEGDAFFSHYDFYDGPDSPGSAGFNAYVSESKARSRGIAKVVTEQDDRTGEDGTFAYMASAPTEEGPRDSVRLEGKTRFDRGLFVLDVRHMPDGCGVWPAFWMTDEAAWPRNGEIDILEGVNGQTVAKTALHTSDRCDMYAHVPPWEKTGDWEWITGIPDGYTGVPDFETSKAADNCWVQAQHQWANEGCTAVHDRNGTLGKPVNENGGGIYVLEWDPANGYIKSWVFSPDIPQNLQDAVDTASSEDPVVPDPSSWGLPYAYFAIGDGSGCAADHFQNMRLVFDLAFCGTVSGNRFGRECAAEAEAFAATDDGGDPDPVGTCDAYVASDPDALEEAYWKIKGVYVYERELEQPGPEVKGTS